jgi:hypothetical protein
MGNTFAGIVISFLAITIFTGFVIGVAYPDPCAFIASHGGSYCKSPWNDFSPVGISVLPTTNPAGFSSTIGAPDASNIVQAQAVAESCGAAGIAGAGTGALSGAVIGSIVPGIGTGIGALAGGVAGYFGIGGLFCNAFQGHPQSALNVANWLNSNPITGSFGDVSAIFGQILQYFNAVVSFAVDYIPYEQALFVMEPVAASMFSALQIFTGIITAIWVVKSLIPGGGS